MTDNQAPSTRHQARTLYLIDGSGFIFRAYHALPPLTSPDGTPVGAVYGFVTMLIKLMDEHKGDSMAVIFDAARKTFRNRIYADYKAHRPPPPDDLIPQFAIVREATEALNLPAIDLADYEADDIIATYARQACAQGYNVVIVSSDKDLMQLICPGVSMYDAMKQKAIGAVEVMEKFGVAPEKVRHVLSLIGDSSDNVPGVPGIGPKTAAELINQFGTVEALLARLAEIKQVKRREMLTIHTDQARISYELIGLKEDVPVPVPLEKLAMRSPEPEKLVAFLRKYGLKTIAARMEQKFGVVPPPAGGRLGGGHSFTPEQASPHPNPPPMGEGKYTILRDESALAAWIARATAKGTVAFDTETTALNPMQAELVGFSLSVEPGEACYVPLAHVKRETCNVERDLFGESASTCHVPRTTLHDNQIPLPRALALLKPLLEDPCVLKVGHNIKYDMLVMRQYDVRIAPIEDTMLLSYALHAGEHGHSMDELAERYLSYKTISYDEVTGTGKNRLRFDEVEIEKAGRYAAEDADVTLKLYHYFKPQLAAERLLTLYETIERPLIPVLAEMEYSGIKVDPAHLATLSKDFAGRMAGYEQEIHALAGQAFNIGSPKQLGEILFDKLQLPGGKKSAKTGAYITDSDVLEELAAGHTLPAKVLEWRQLSKLKSTYSDALLQQIDPKTGRVHTCFAQAIASTGRLSSNDPNLQNIPIRTEDGRKIRGAFVAEEGCTLLSADYSQIELRLLAHMADIAPLKAAFKNGDDIHAITASQMFGVPVSQVGADLRRSAKTINFGIIYGISAHGLSQRLGIGRSEAAAYIEQYFKQYPGIRAYMEASKEFARQHGYVATLFGRRCHVPGILDKNPARRAFSERAAINAPLQGTAADIIKRAMVSLGSIQHSAFSIQKEKPVFLNPECRMLNASFQMLLQVHDELVFEVKDAALAEAKTLVKKHMEQAAQLSVPLVVDIGIGRHWGEAH